MKLKSVKSCLIHTSTFFYFIFLTERIIFTILNSRLTMSIANDLMFAVGNKCVVGLLDSSDIVMQLHLAEADLLLWLCSPKG